MILTADTADMKLLAFQIPHGLTKNCPKWFGDWIFPIEIDGLPIKQWWFSSGGSSGPFRGGSLAKWCDPKRWDFMVWPEKKAWGIPGIPHKKCGLKNGEPWLVIHSILGIGLFFLRKSSAGSSAGKSLPMTWWILIPHWIITVNDGHEMEEAS
jgi:hypothetical protein